MTETRKDTPFITPDWDFNSVPHELKQLKTWVPCYIKGSLDNKQQEIATAKRPIGGPTSPFSWKSFNETKAKLLPGQYFGICLTPEDDIVCIDVDGLPASPKLSDLPQIIQMMLLGQPTYVEYSPSRCGIHVYYKTNKHLLAHRKDQDKATKGFEGSVFFRNQFLTVTGHIHPASISTIANIEAHFFETLVLNSSKIKAISSAPKQKGLSKATYTLDSIRRWLSSIPPNLSESPQQPLLETAYSKFDPPIEHPDDYIHWQYVAAATHYAAAELREIKEGEELFVEWSLRGTNDGEQNIRQKYRDNAPKYDGDDITYKTLISLASATRPIWPYPIIKEVKKKMVPTKYPDTNHLSNWEALFKQYRLTLRQNEISKAFLVKGPDPIINTYFREETKPYDDAKALKSSLLYFAQNNGMTKAQVGQNATATQWWVDSSLETYNPIKEWIETAQRDHPLPKSSSISWFQTLWETLHLYNSDKDIPLYRAYLKKNLMGIIRAHFYTGRWDHTTGIVILSGGEASRKSSWVGNLLPPELQDYVVHSQAALDEEAKKIALEAGVAQIWIKNEVESFISGNKRLAHKDSALKSFLVDNHDFYRPLFGIKPIKAKRKCIFFGTTNETQLQMSSTGNRRLQIIPVKFCDTEALEKIPLVKVYQELLNEFLATREKDRPSLWTLSTEEISETNEVNDEERRSTSPLDDLVLRAYDFDTPFDIENFKRSYKNTSIYDRSKLLPIAKIVAQLENTATRQESSLLASGAVKHALRRIVGKWTNSITQWIELDESWSIQQGMIKYRPGGGKKISFSGFCMPEPISPFEDLKTDEDSENSLI